MVSAAAVRVALAGVLAGALAPGAALLLTHRMNPTTGASCVSRSDGRSYASDGTVLGDYVGPIESGVAHGQGELSLFSGDRYVGQFYYGRVWGTGTWYFASGYRYEGEVRLGICEGHGTLYFPDGGVRYTGQFNDGRFHGEGKAFYVDGAYTGQFQRGKRHGFGTFRNADGTSHDGFYESDRPISGKGTFYDPQGYKFVGELVDGEMEGEGQQIEPNGNTYVGQYKGGQPNGFGKYTYGGNSYEGGFRNGQQHGNGTATFVCGDRFVGEYQDGVKVRGTFSSSSGTYTGPYGEDNQASGFGRFEYPNGNVYIGQFDHGELHGVGTFYIPSGDGHDTFEGPWWKGKKHGEFVYTHVDGRQETQAFFNGNGVFQG